jgi:hypothetical protein
MRIQIPCTTLGLLFAAAAPAAHAQTVYTEEPDGTVIAQPAVTAPAPAVVTQPAQTVRTVTTVQTERPVSRRRVVVTRQTTVRDSVVPAAPTVVAPTEAAGDQGPLYDVVSPAPAAPAVAGTGVPFYHYVYEPDRILVIDPSTGVAVQAIPR